MKKLILVTTFLLCACSLFAFDTAQSAQELLDSAKLQSNLFYKDAKPFQLDVDFVAQIQTPLQGHLTLKWESSDHWWRKIVMGEFVQVDVRNGEMQYTSRNASFTPEKVDELIHLLEFAERPDGTIKKRKDKVENGIEVACLGTEYKKVEAHEICVNSVSHEILKNERTLGGDEQVERYSNYADFQAYRYPRKLELDAKGRKIIIATVTGLTMSAFDRALLVPPDGAIERRHCKDMTTPVAISTPEPQYPPSASLSRIMADNSVNFTIETDGSVSHVHLLRGSIQPMDDATLEAVRGWRFKPAMCGTEPVVSDLTVSVSFRLR